VRVAEEAGGGAVGEARDGQGGSGRGGGWSGFRGGGWSVGARRDVTVGKRARGEELSGGGRGGEVSG